MKRLYMFSLIIGSALLLISCDSDYGGYSYSDFDQFNDWDELDTLGQGEYEFIYIVDRDFVGCESHGTHRINEPLFEFAQEGEDVPNMHIANFRTMSGQRPINVASRGPKLLVIYEGEVQDKYYGANPIFEFIEGFEASDYWMPDTRGQLDDYDETYGGYTYDDFDHLDNWDDIRDMAWEAPELIYVYGRNLEGSSEESKALNETMFDFGMENSQDIKLNVANLYEMIGLRIDDLVFEEPALLFIGHDQIQRAIYGTEAILEFMEEADEHDYEQYMVLDD